jgi:hypothetical protein
MAAEIQFSYSVSGRTLYAVVRTTVGTVWNGTSFEAYNESNWSNYDIAMTEQGTSGYYVGTFPTVSAGVYNVDVRDRAGGSPAVTDTRVGSGSLEWDGSAVVPLSSRLPTSSYTAPDNASITAIKERTDNLPDSPAAVGDAMTLESAERTAIATALLDLSNGVESSVTVRQLLRAIGSALAGNVTTSGGSYKAISNSGTTRLTVTDDGSGNRTVTLKL